VVKASVSTFARLLPLNPCRLRSTSKQFPETNLSPGFLNPPSGAGGLNCSLQAVTAISHLPGFSPSILQINKYWQDWLIVKIGINGILAFFPVVAISSNLSTRF